MSILDILYPYLYFVHFLMPSEFSVRLFLKTFVIFFTGSQEVIISCNAGIQISTHLIGLVSISDFVRKILSESSDSLTLTADDALLIIPHLDPNHLEIFLR